MIRVLAVCLVLLATPAFAQLPVGANAPDFSLTSVDRVPYTLSDYTDNQVAVLFFVGWG